jgi:hypothetical protein
MKRRILLMLLSALAVLAVAFSQYRRSMREHYRKLDIERRDQWINETLTRITGGNSRVHFYSTANTDMMLKAIRGMPEVQTIVFEQAMDLSDEALMDLQSLPNLTRLEFRGQPEIDDESLSLIAQCQHVEVLVIRYCKVTDDGLPVIAEMRRLKEFHHAGQFDEQALTRLRERLPELISEIAL